jgi:asparagine synthase (glutamine-hydrolysing)
MFSFAILNNENQSLFCARDRFGEKPFYYTLTPNGEFVFASEIKSILASGLVNPELDLSSLSYYLKRLSVPVHKTIYRNIQVLPPAHYLIFNNGQITVNRYWHPPHVNHDIRYEDAQMQFKYLFEKAISEQMVADVPVGAFLSGGVDSGSVVAAASRINNTPLQTFSFGFEGSKNELDEARNVANLLHTDHTEFHERDFDMAALFLQMQDIYDEPFADSSNIPMFLISRFASQKLKVVLTGDGGDELLGGYNSWYQPLIDVEHSFNGKKWMYEFFLRTPFGAYLKKDTRRELKSYKSFKLGNLVNEIHKQQNVFFSDSVIESMHLPIAHDEFGISHNLNTADDAMLMDLQNYMPADILVKTDRASMTNSLELRAPFLNVDLAEFCLSLPYKYKINQYWNKIILRDYLKKEFPLISQNPQKKGFGAPVDHWLTMSSIQELKKDLLASKSSKIYTYIPYEKALPYIEKNNYHSWILLTLAAWLEKHCRNGY